MFNALINTTDPAAGWVWRDPAGAIESPFVLFLPDGRIGGSAATRFLSWRHCAGGIVLTRPDGTEAPLAGTIHPGRPWPIRLLPPLRNGRRNLVVLRAGDQSLHPLGSRPWATWSATGTCSCPTTETSRTSGAVNANIFCR